MPLRLHIFIYAYVHKAPCVTQRACRYAYITSGLFNRLFNRMAMRMLRGVAKSAHRCVESIQFSVIERETTASSFWGVSRNENMHRLRTMARLHDSLFRIQLEMQEYEAKFELLRIKAETSFQQQASEAQQKDDFNKMRLVELQKKALSKSENILLFTLNGLEKKGYIQNINNIIQYTVKQHKMVQEEGLIDDSQHESLVDAFDQISNNVAKGQDILETLDAQSWNVENEQEQSEEGCAEDDSAFSRWRNKMSMQSQSGPLVLPAAAAAGGMAIAPYTVNNLDSSYGPTPSTAYELEHMRACAATTPQQYRSLQQQQKHELEKSLGSAYRI